MAAQAIKVEKLLVELDCLLDTRLGTCGLISAETTEAMLASGKYHSREIDVFDGFDMEEFRRVYNRRDTNTLANSVATNLFKFLLEIIGQLSRQALARPYLDAVEVEVNTHPYTLSDAEKEMMVKVIAHRIRNLAKVSLVDIAPEKLDPKYCKASFGAMFMYDPWTWLNLQTDAFITTRLPEVLLYAPKLYTHKRPSDDELERLTKDAPHPFLAAEMQSSPLVGLTLIDVAYFSSSVRPSSDTAA
jgi:hypothetical protein